MTIAVGTECYNVSTGRVVACGVALTEDEHNEALDTSVRAIVNDEEGMRRAREAVESLPLTEFERQNLDAVLNQDQPLEDWRVGEAYGEAYLTEHKDCFFPWLDKWDERESGSSLPGADLAGMQQTNDAELPYRFAFGEIKTSEEQTYPPGMMYGRTGLKQQMEDLRDRDSIRADLFRYLMMRVNGAAWESQFQSATKRFLANSKDVAIFGVLIRDVAPDQRDLQARSRGLANGHPATMHVELLAIYLPIGAVKALAAFYANNGGGA